MRKISAILIVIMLFLTFSVNAESSFTIDEAKKLAVENSNLLKAADIKIESDEINAREELAKKNRTKNTSPPAGRGVSVVESTLQRRGYYSDVAAVSLTLSKLSRDRTVNTIEFTAVSSYYTLANAMERLKIKEEALSIAKENVKAVAMKLELGTVSKLELQSSEFTVQQLELEIKTLKRDVEYARLSFNNALGLDSSENVNLLEKLVTSEPVELNLEESIKAALENRYEVIASGLQLSLAEKEAECYGVFYTKFTYHYKLKEYNVEIAKSNLENTKNSISLAVKKAYSDYLNSYDTVLMSNIAIQSAENLHGLAKSKFESGMGTNIDVIKAQNDLDNAKFNKVQAETAYCMSMLLFESQLKSGIDSR